MRGFVLLLGLLSSFTFAQDPHWKRLHYNKDLCPDNLGIGPSCAISNWVYQGHTYDEASDHAIINGRAVAGTLAPLEVMSDVESGTKFTVKLYPRQAEDQANCDNSSDIPIIFANRIHYNPWHLLVEHLMPIHAALLGLGLEQEAFRLVVVGNKQGSARDGPEGGGSMFYSALFRKVAGAPQIDINKLKEGFCAKTAIFMFYRNFYLNNDMFRDNPPARILGASFQQWLFQNTPSILGKAPQPKRLTVVKRSGWRQIVNGNEFVQKARALGWQAEEELLGHNMFWQQVDSIRASEIIISPHGAELAFVVAFMHASTVLVEVKNYRYSPAEPDVSNSGCFDCYPALSHLFRKTILGWHSREADDEVVQEWAVNTQPDIYGFKHHDVRVPSSAVDLILKEAIATQVQPAYARGKDFGLRRLNEPCNVSCGPAKFEVPGTVKQSGNERDYI